MTNILYNENCFDIMQIEIEKGTKFDLILCDSPYGIGYQSNMKKNKDLPMFYDRNLAWLPKWLNFAHKLLKDDGHIYLFAPQQRIDVWKQEFENFFICKNLIVWNKKAFGMGDLYGQFAPSYEFILFGCKEQGKKLNGKRECDVWEFSKVRSSEHPTQKPYDLIKKIVLKSTNESDFVFDGFAGTNITGLVCKDFGRNYIGCELYDEHYNNAKRKSLKYFEL